MPKAEASEQGKQDTPYQQPLRVGAARAAIGSGMVEIVTRVLTVVLSIATARALEPREVGLLGLAVIIIGVVSMLGFYPETAAVAAGGEGNHSKYALAATAIRASVLALSLSVLFLAFSFLAHRLTEDDSSTGPLRSLVGVLVWVPLIELISGYPQVLLQRRLDLNFLAWIGMVQPVVFIGLAVFLLVKGYGYMGVAWANLSGGALVSILLWSRLWRAGLLDWEGWPSLAFTRKQVKASARVFIGGFGGFLGSRLDNLLVAGAIGSTAMSFYSMAWNASRTPANVFARAINFVIVPTVARIQDDSARIERALCQSLRHSYLLLAPVCAALYVSAPLLVFFVLGAKWLPLVPCLQIMCVSSFVVPLLYVSGALLTGMGRAHLIGISTVIHISSLVMLIPPMARHWGIVGAAWGELIAVYFSTISLWLIARRAVPEIRWGLLSTLFVPVSASICAGVFAKVSAAYIAEDLPRMIAELGIVAIGFCIFTVLLGGRTRLLDLLSLLRGLTRRPALVTE